MMTRELGEGNGEVRTWIDRTLEAGALRIGVHPKIVGVPPVLVT